MAFFIINLSVVWWALKIPGMFSEEYKKRKNPFFLNLWSIERALFFRLSTRVGFGWNERKIRVVCMSPRVCVCASSVCLYDREGLEERQNALCAVQLDSIHMAAPRRGA